MSMCIVTVATTLRFVLVVRIEFGRFLFWFVNNLYLRYLRYDFLKLTVCKIINLCLQI